MLYGSAANRDSATASRCSFEVIRKIHVRGGAFTEEAAEDVHLWMGLSLERDVSRRCQDAWVLMGEGLANEAPIQHHCSERRSVEANARP